jgi:hypothetical protein
MSELIQARDTNIRKNLLATASALALVGCVAAAKAEDAERPTVWIELGGQLSRIQNSQETFAPALMDVRPPIFDPSQKFEKPPLHSIDEEGKISIHPKGSDWVVSAAARYGRVASKKHVTQHTNNPYPFYKYLSSPPIYPQHYARKFAETISKSEQQHLILDFQVGKDVGLGMFGGNSVSSISLGVRFAHFRSASDVILRSDPDWAIKTKYIYGIRAPIQNYHSNSASFSANRSFHGIGPALSWEASTPFLGTPQAGELNVDWGINASVLFGRQKTKTHHQTTGRYHYWYPSAQHTRPITYQAPSTPDHSRTKSVVVPNIGSFAAISLQYPNAKVSLGYRADFFFGAMDTGIDARRTSDVGFHGPFATVSIGLGG